VSSASARDAHARRSALAVAFTGLALLVTGAGAAHPREPLAPADPLAAEDIPSYAALLATADAEQGDTAVIRQGLASHSPAVRIEAIRVIGQVRVRELVPLVRRATADRDTAVAATAAFALGLMRDSGSVGVLASALAGPPTVGAEAAWALGEIGSPAREAIEGAIRTRHVAMTTLAALVRATALLRPVPVRLDAILVAPSAPADGGTSPVAGRPGTTRDARSSEEGAVQRAAAYALSRHPQPAAVRILLELRSSADPDTRMYVARGLAHSATGDSLAAQARDALGALTRDSAAHVRAVAVEALATFGASGRPTVVAALRDPDANVRIAAAGVLDRVLGTSRDEWSSAFNADTTFTVRRGIVGAALRAGVTLEAIDHDNPDRWQRSGDWRYRAAVADAAVGTPIGRIVQVVLPLTRDPDGRVRATAYEAFAPWADSADASRHPWRRTYLYDSIRDPDPIVRATILGALDSGATARDAAVALDAYRRGGADSLADARIAALGLIEAAWSHDSTHFSDSLRREITGLTPPQDLRELDAVGSGSLWVAWRASRHARKPPHPPSWYDSVTRAIVVPALAGRASRATINTAKGPIVVALAGDEAPLTVANFVALARRGYYDRTAFHRVDPAFVAQDGDPRGDGNGGPPYAIRDELNRLRYDRGILGMALSGPNTGGSQYFFTLTPQPHLDAHYTAFGRLVAGYATLDEIIQGDSIAHVSVQ
jgi:cyclophilin family peptidyl-prolyl cis-trans isomerase/HEAT repeat protein